MNHSWLSCRPVSLRPRGSLCPSDAATPSHPHPCFLGQVTLSSSHLGEKSDVGGLSDVLGSLIAAQVSGKVVGGGADEVSSDYFRLSTGLYDAATVGTVQVRSESGVVVRGATPLPFALWLGSCFPPPRGKSTIARKRTRSGSVRQGNKKEYQKAVHVGGSTGGTKFQPQPCVIQPRLDLCSPASSGR